MPPCRRGHCCTLCHCNTRHPTLRRRGIHPTPRHDCSSSSSRNSTRPGLQPPKLRSRRFWAPSTAPLCLLEDDAHLLGRPRARRGVHPTPFGVGRPRMNNDEGARLAGAGLHADRELHPRRTTVLHADLVLPAARNAVASPAAQPLCEGIGDAGHVAGEPLLIEGARDGELGVAARERLDELPPMVILRVSCLVGLPGFVDTPVMQPC
jgi:hypothetical protein